MRLTLLFLFLASMPAAASGVAHAGPATGPVVQVSPHTVKVGGRVTVTASHLTAGAYYTLLLAVPDRLHPKAEAFFGVVPKANSKGRFQISARVPTVLKCGSAVVYVQRPRHSDFGQAKVTLTGCVVKKGTGKVPAPPAPPPTKKP